jgi:hypothetical protein
MMTNKQVLALCACILALAAAIIYHADRQPRFQISTSSPYVAFRADVRSGVIDWCTVNQQDGHVTGCSVPKE